MLGRRGFLGLLGFGAVAAPAMIKEIVAQVPSAQPSLIELAEYEYAVGPGIQIAYGTKSLIVYRNELMREYLRGNLFAPYNGPR